MLAAKAQKQMFHMRVYSNNNNASRTTILISNSSIK